MVSADLAPPVLGTRVVVVVATAARGDDGHWHGETATHELVCRGPNVACRAVVADWPAAEDATRLREALALAKRDAFTQAVASLKREAS